MSYVIAAPEMMTSAATDLATIGSNVAAAHTAAATRTLAVLPAAADEVSAGIAHLFSQHAANYQAMAAQAAAFNDQFVQHLTAGAFSYASIEAAIASFLQELNVSANSFVSTLAAIPGQVATSLTILNAASPFVIIGALLVVGVAVTLAVAELYSFLTTGRIVNF
jgi:hypothetical protein